MGMTSTKTFGRMAPGHFEPGLEDSRVVGQSVGTNLSWLLLAKSGHLMLLM
jgi:hypothetical protein